MIFASAPAAGPRRAHASSATSTELFGFTGALNTPERRRMRSPASHAGVIRSGADAEDLLEHAERGSRAAVGADEAGVPALGLRTGVPLVQVDAADARAQARDVAQDEARDLGRVRLALRQLDRRAVAARDEAAGLGQPDLAGRHLEQVLRARGLQAVGADVVVKAPVARLARDLDEAADPPRRAGLIEQVGGEDAARLARALEREVVARVELGPEAPEVGLVPGREVLDPRVAGAEGAELGLQLGGRREPVGAAREARAVEGDQWLDAGGLGRVEPAVELGHLPRAPEGVPGDGDAG